MPPSAPLLRLLLSLLLALACGLATAVEPLRIGIFAYRPKPIMEQRFQPLADYLAKALGGQPVELLALEQAEMEAALAENRLDFLMTNPSHYLVVRSRSQLASIVATVISRDDGLEVSSLGGVIVTVLLEARRLLFQFIQQPHFQHSRFRHPPHRLRPSGTLARITRRGKREGNFAPNRSRMKLPGIRKLPQSAPTTTAGTCQCYWAALTSRYPMSWQ